MQLNKPNKAYKKPKPKVEESQRKRPTVGVQNQDRGVKPDKKVDAEEALIDLYDEPYKNSNDNEEVVINIDFTKPAELFGNLARKVKEKLRVAQQNFNLEFVKSIKFSSKRERRRSFKIIGGVLASFLAIWILGSLMFGGEEKSLSEVSQVQGVTGEGISTVDNTNFELLYPEGRTQNDFESVVKVSPPGAPEAYAFVDKIDDVGVQVSQQALPERFKSDQAQELEALATGFAANESVNGNTFEGYIGLNRPGGPQSFIGIKNDLLILIKTDSEIDVELISEYVDSLT